LWVWIRVDACVCTSAGANAVDRLLSRPSEVGLGLARPIPSSGHSPFSTFFPATLLSRPLSSSSRFPLWLHPHSLFVAGAQLPEQASVSSCRNPPYKWISFPSQSLSVQQYRCLSIPPNSLPHPSPHPYHCHRFPCLKVSS
jgi:hypothetical protein